VIELAGTRRGAWIRAAGTTAGVIAADQVTKVLARQAVDVGDSDGIFPGLELVHVRNRGVAFGFLSGGGGLVVAATLVALAFLLVLFIRNPRRRLMWLPTGLLVGGALGNLLDRLGSGEVTDFLKIPLWPAFNLADVAITVGVLALLWVLEGPRRERAA
jgi:signal peptidase II